MKNFNKKRKSVFFSISLAIALIFIIMLILYTIVQIFSLNIFFKKQEEYRLQKIYSDIKMDTSEVVSFKNINNFYNYIYELSQNDTNKSFRIISQDKVEYKTNFMFWNYIPYVENKEAKNINQYKINGTKYMVLTKPINVANKKLNIQIVQMDENFSQFLVGYLPIFIGVIFIGIILSLLSGIIISRRILMKIKNLSKTMSEVENSNNLAERIKIYKPYDEFDELNSVFNSMMDKVECVFNKQNQFISDASHELRTPLTALKGHLGLIKRWGKKDEQMLDESLDICLEEIDRLTNMVNSLLLLSKEDEKEINLENILSIVPNAIIHDLIKHYKVLNTRVNFDIFIENNLKIKMQKDDLKQLLIIFIDNAIKYNDKENPLINIEVKKKQTQISLVIRDNGIGISNEDLPKILDRFYKVDKSRNADVKSFGIGLSIAKTIIENYNGEINIESEIKCGTKIEILL